MKTIKKLFKHGGSLAMVIPAEFIKYLDADEIAVELQHNKNQKPSLLITPSDEFDKMENDPLFSLFIEALYKNALANPEKLTDVSEIFSEEVDTLLEGVEIDDEE